MSPPAGTRLHEVRRAAPEFYMEMPHYYSWAKVIWDFVTDPAVTPFKCVRRLRRSRVACSMSVAWVAGSSCARLADLID